MSRVFLLHSAVVVVLISLFKRENTISISFIGQRMQLIGCVVRIERHERKRLDRRQLAMAMFSPQRIK
jgi:hypothetical protein